MANTFIQIAHTSNRYIEGADVEEISIRAARNVRVRNVRASRIVIGLDCTDIEIDGFHLSGKYSMPLMMQNPRNTLRGIHIHNGVVDCAESNDIEGDLQAISCRANIEEFNLHNIWVKHARRDAVAFYKHTFNRWDGLDIHHIYVTDGLNVSDSKYSGGLHFGSDKNPGTVTNCIAHDCYIRDTDGYGVRNKGYGVDLENIISVRTLPDKLIGVDNLITVSNPLAHAADIQAEVIRGQITTY